MCCLWQTWWGQEGILVLTRSWLFLVNGKGMFFCPHPTSPPLLSDPSLSFDTLVSDWTGCLFHFSHLRLVLFCLPFVNIACLSHMTYSRSLGFDASWWGSVCKAGFRSVLCRLTALNDVTNAVRLHRQWVKTLWRAVSWASDHSDGSLIQRLVSAQDSVRTVILHSAAVHQCYAPPRCRTQTACDEECMKQVISCLHLEDT